MASHRPSETNSHIADSIISLSTPPRSDHSEPPLQFICSFGGEILPRRHNANQLCYIGGDTRILSVNHNVTFSSLLTDLSDLTGDTETTVKYNLPNEDLDALISVRRDKDVENMMVAYNRLIRSGLHGSSQLLRLFLFPKNSSNLASYTNDCCSEYEEDEHEEEQNLTNLEELNLESRPATGAVPPPVTYNRLEYSDGHMEPQLELKEVDSSVVEPLQKQKSFDIPLAMQNLETLWTWLNDKDVHRIKIEGESGTGKAWMVRQIIARSHASNLFKIVTWASDSGADTVDVQNRSKSTGVMAANAGASWWKKDAHMAHQGRGYLLVLEQSCDLNLGVVHPKSQIKLYKHVFVGSPSKDFNVEMDKVLELKVLSQIDARLLFESRSGLQLDDPKVCKFAHPLLQKCNGNLSMILVLAENLRRNLEESSTTLRTVDTLQKASDLLIDRSIPIVEVICEMLPSKQVRDCFLHFLFYFSVRDPKDPINVVRLIAFWILEGCLDGFNCLADAYRRGQDILAELTDRCLLIRHDDEHVCAQSCTLFENSGLITMNLHSKVFSITDFLNLAPIFLMNEELKIGYSDNLKRYYPKVLLVYGNEARKPHEIPDVFSEKTKDLHILSLQHTGIKSLPSTLSTLESLNALILRDCSSLENVNQIRAVRRLEYLDLSGASSLNILPDNLFQNMKHLRHLDLSNTQLKKLPSSFYNLTMLHSLIFQGCSHLQMFLERFFYDNLNHLSYLILSGCSQVHTMPHPDAFPHIEVLDLSGASAFREFQGESEETYHHFRKVDLSGTKVVDVHFLSSCVHLQVLLLKHCSKIDTVPCLSSEVRILDLSGSGSFKIIEDKYLGDNLLLLDLSRTQIEKLPMFSINSTLSQLLLRECAHLEEIPPSEFQKLEVLDLSGSINFKKFNDVASIKLRLLKTLDLSATQISELPNLSECSYLQQLVLRNCLRLEMLPQLKELTELKVLDLSGSSAFRKFQETDMEKMVKLQDLNLSGTQVVSIPSLDECHDLRMLILRGCLKLESLPHLEALSRLQVLDLSGSVSFTTFQDQSSGSKYHLPEGSNLDAVPLKYMHSLEKVDVSGTSIQKLPSHFSGYGNLNYLLLKECSNLKMLPQPDSFNNLKVLDVSCQQFEGSSSGISVSTHLRFLVTLNNNFLWEFDYGKEFEKFYFILCSLKDWGQEKDNYLRRQEAVFRDICYQTNHIPWLTEEVPDKFFKICGFQTFPSGAEKVLVHAELLYVENNDFMTRLSDLDPKHVNVMKECWIESCQNMESCFYGEEEEENDALGKCLRNLWVSKLSHLKCLFRDVVKSESFTCLKNLYIECCPSLITLFSSHLELKHLDTLKIKFCNKLENVSGDMLLTEQAFPRLKTLSLWKLPKLNRVCTGALPSLEYLAVKRCPKLEKLPFSLNNTNRTLKIKGEKLWWDNLKCEDDIIKLHISFTELPQFL